MSQSFEERTGYSMLSEASEGDVVTLISGEGPSSSFVSRGGLAVVDFMLSISLFDDSTRAYLDACEDDLLGSSGALEDFEFCSLQKRSSCLGGDSLLLYSLEHSSSSSSLSSSSSASTPLPVWEGSLHFPLSFFHFQVAGVSLNEAENSVAQFLESNHGNISYEFDVANHKWQCVLLDGIMGLVRFDISLLYNSLDDEIIIEWNRLRGNSGMFSKYFNQSKASFTTCSSPSKSGLCNLSQLQKSLSGECTTLSSTLSSSSTSSSTVGEIANIDADNTEREVSKATLEGMQKLIMSDVVSAIAILVPMSSCLAENCIIVDMSIEVLNEEMSALFVSLQNGHETTTTADMQIALLNYSESLLLGLEMIKARLGNAQPIRQEFVKIIQTTLMSAAALQNFFPDSESSKVVAALSSISKIGPQFIDYKLYRPHFQRLQLEVSHLFASSQKR